MNMKIAIAHKAKSHTPYTRFIRLIITLLLSRFLNHVSISTLQKQKPQVNIIVHITVPTFS